MSLSTMEVSPIKRKPFCQLGVALGFDLQFSEAVNALNDAIGVLQKRIDNLKTCTESQGKNLS
jgi:hypothetical protein